MEFFNNSVFFGVMLSLLAYGIGALLKQRFKLAIFNPLLIAVIIVIAVLAVSGIENGKFELRSEIHFLSAHTSYNLPCYSAL